MRYLVVPIVLAVAGAACSRAEPQADASVVAAIRSAPAPDRIHAINDAAHRHRGPSSSLAPLLAEQDPRVRWAAAYVAALWADETADVEALAPHLDDPDEATRAVIAGSLAGLGHDGARQALSALSTSAAAMPYADPPLTVGQFATDALAAIDRAGAAR